MSEAEEKEYQKIIGEKNQKIQSLEKEIDHVKDVWIGISDGKDLIIKRLEKQIKHLNQKS